MSNPAPICTHIKTNGIRCGSPAVSGAEHCHHHSALKTALTTPRNNKPGRGGFAPIPFVFPEDRASMQINFFLLLQAYNEQRIDQRIYNSFLNLLRSMARNLGKTGSLVEEARDQEPGTRDQKKSDQRSAVSDQKNKVQGTGRKAQEGEERVAPASEPFEFSPELFAKFEEIESLDPNDPTYAERIRAAVAEGTKELKAQGLDLMDISPVAGSR